MSQHNMRKEPVFGTPTKAPESVIENAVENAAEHVEEAVQPAVDATPAPQKLSFSVRSTQNPGFTFTRPLTRPADSAKEFSTLEEQAMLKAAEAAQPVQQADTSAAISAQSEITSPAAVEPQPEMSVKPEQHETAAPAEEKVTSTMNNTTIERVIPTQPQAAPEKEPLLTKVPSKLRRILLVVLLALALLFAFFLLKPNTPETVGELQQQGTSLPIEFRPVDEAEAKRAEQEARAQQEALLAQQAAQQAQAEQQAQQAQQAAQAQAPQPAATATVAAAAPAVAPAAPAAPATEVAKVEKPVVTPKPVVVAPVTKPETTGSVIHQPETPVKAEPKKVEKVEKVVKPAAQPAPVAKAEPKAAAKPAVEEAAPAAGSSKTMVVPQGTSLMQVFRNHNLNIADVNAMSKVNNVVSNLKVGEKVTVRLDSNNRVAEMHIGSGGKFVRQANGSYTFSK